MTLPIKLNFLDRAIQVYNFHVQQNKTESSWTIEKTAKALNRSVGSVCQDIKLANWSRTHDKQLRRCRSMRSALDYINGKEKERMKEIL